MKTLHFHTGLTEKIGILLEGNTCKDIVVDRPTQEAQLYSIYLGKVRNVDSSIEAAFIDLGMKKMGFLGKSEIPFIKKEENLSSYLTAGASIMVQVIKEAYQDKGPGLTANITLNGNYIIYLPKGNYIASSRKIADDVRNAWTSFFKNKLIEEEGIILRTNGAKASEELVMKELEELRAKWKILRSGFENNRAPALLSDFPLAPDQMLNQYQSYQIKAITFDEKKILKKMQTRYPLLANKMSVRNNANQIGKKTITQWLDEALKPVVKKEDGITLTVEQTEALTVIDIDSSQFQSRQNKRNTLFRINQKAVAHCAEEIRKRNLSGIILIDFLKMKKKEEYIIQEEMKKKLNEDPIRTEIYGFTNLGLMELTRKRERASLDHLMIQRPKILKKTVEAIGFQLERELAEWNTTAIEALIIRCSSAVVHFITDYLQEELSDKLTYHLYFYPDDGEEAYTVLRAGSRELIDLYRREHPELSIDSL